MRFSRFDTPKFLFASAALMVLTALDAGAASKSIVISSGDVEHLYSAVADPANANKTLILEPGIYTLTSIGPFGSRPRGGSLMLQPGMRLLGGNTYQDSDGDGVWDATLDGQPVVSGATVIDGTGVEPYESLSPSGEPELACDGEAQGNDISGTTVVAFRHRSSIARLTVIAGPGALALSPPHSSYLPENGYDAEISDNFLDNGSFSTPGAAFMNMSCRMRNASSTLNFKRNIVRGNLFGIAIINALTNQEGDIESGPKLQAFVSANHFIGNGFGIHARNTMGTDGGRIDIRSTGNLFEFNFIGLEATAGTDLATSTGARGNRFDLVSQRDSFSNNSIGVLGVGAWNVNPFTLSGNSANDLRIELDEDHFEGGDAAHIWSMFPEPRQDFDTGNRVNVLVSQSSLGGDPLPPFVFIDTFPGDTNTVKIVGSATAFRASNGVLPVFAQYLVPPNPFDLAGTTNMLHFAPVVTGYELTAGTGVQDTNIGDAIDYSEEPNGDFPIDDDTAEIPLLFAFPFEGQSYTEVFVNTDGNLTFGEGDPYSGARDVSRLISGAPRIAALLTDLAPNMGGSVHAHALVDRAVITWTDVPSWGAGLTDLNTFQITLYPDGAIDIVYDVIGIPDAVVGIAPGGNLESETADEDLSDGSTATGWVFFEAFYGLIGP